MPSSAYNPAERRIVERLALLRERHPELADRLSWTSLQRILERDEIVVLKKPIREKARMTAMGGVGVLTFNSSLPPREWLFAGAHEYAHWVLHHDAEPTRHEFVSYSRDRREPEANYLAEWLLRGPQASPAPVLLAPWPDTRSSPHRRVARVVPPAFDPYTAPLALTIERPTPRYGGRQGETPLQRALRLVRPAPRPLPAGERSDAEVILYEHGGVVRYVDGEGRRWRVYDVAFLPERTVVDLGRPVARYRVFVNAVGVRRKYVFRNKWERRDVAARHFERQLRDAIEIPAATTSGNARATPDVFAAKRA